VAGNFVVLLLRIQLSIDSVRALDSPCVPSLQVIHLIGIRLPGKAPHVRELVAAF
jgi:hypothetical protein